MIGVQLADVSTRYSSHPQGKGEARCKNAEALDTVLIPINEEHYELTHHRFQHDNDPKHTCR